MSIIARDITEEGISSKGLKTIKMIFKKIKLKMIFKKRIMINYKKNLKMVPSKNERYNSTK